MFTVNFLKQLLERALKSAAQGALTIMALAEVTDAFALDWEKVAGGAAFMFLFSALTTIASGVITPDSQPSLVESPTSEGVV